MSVPADRYVAKTPGAQPTPLRGKLAGLPPGPAPLLPRTRPSNGIRNGRYGQGFYENGYGNGYRNSSVTLEIRCQAPQSSMRQETDAISRLYRNKWPARPRRAQEV